MSARFPSPQAWTPNDDSHIASEDGAVLTHSAATGDPMGEPWASRPQSEFAAAFHPDVLPTTEMRGALSSRSRLQFCSVSANPGRLAMRGGPADTHLFRLPPRAHGAT